ncbi:MAG: Enoyl-CoA hydratase/isomerase [Sphingobacteriaceae bacterium]|nr:Enoyl-CoA hydratase/isomerase [Sphingobacteriaceae bacterium]
METIQVSIQDRVAVITLNRGRANAINSLMVDELQQMFQNIESDSQVSGVILTGKEGFFSAGLDLIELYDYDEAQIKDFWQRFIKLTESLASFKKPFISAINGHSPAGGCVLAICSDYRVMADGKYIIGLNEVPVGLIVPENIFHLYSFWIGDAKASRYLLEGKLMNPQEALEAGLVDEVVNPNTIRTAAERQMKKYIQLNAETWQKSKMNIRKSLLTKVGSDQTETINAMLEQWWSPQTRSILKTIIQNLKPANT